MGIRMSIDDYCCGPDWRVHGYELPCCCGICPNCVEAFIVEFASCEEAAGEWLWAKCGNNLDDFDGDPIANELLRDMAQAYMKGDAIPGRQRFIDLMKKFSSEAK